ncbi:MAG TPA: V-type ATP synthase subunit D [Gemmatimonadaceae bacterium]|jgi:V/A-type H+-transporting ATPase subunit D
MGDAPHTRAPGRIVTPQRLIATRNNLLRARAQLGQVRRGADAVGRKRQALVSHLFHIARPAIDTRAEIARRVTEAASVLLDAVSGEGMAALRALARPSGVIEVDVEPATIWGVPVADLSAVMRVRRTLEARGTPPGSTQTQTVAATDAFEFLVELLIEAAPSEVRVARLAAAVATTSRQLRLLRERVEPRLIGQIAGVTHTLEEREREEHVRLKHLQRRRAVATTGAFVLTGRPRRAGPGYPPAPCGNAADTAGSIALGSPPATPAPRFLL